MREIEKILVIKWGALGDLVAGTVALRALREYYLSARITVLANDLMYEVCPPGTLADEILVYDSSTISMMKNLTLLQQFIRMKFDLAVNLRWSSERSALLTWLSRAKLRAGSGPTETRWMYNVKAPLYQGRRHEFHRHLDIVHALHVPVGEPRPYIFISDVDKQTAERYMSENGLVKSTTLVMHPGASTPSKSWLPERFIEIGKRFIRRFHSNVLVTWGREEESLAEHVVNAIGQGAMKSPPTTIGCAAALIANAGMCLCNYSGIMNIAMAVKTPLLALGCTNAEDWGPYGPLHRTVNTAREHDSYSDAERTERMREITVEQVWSMLEHRWMELKFHIVNASVN